MPASVMPTTLNFTTLTPVAPRLISSSPADDATAVAVGSNIKLTFSDYVKAGTGYIVISDGADIRTIAVNDSSQVTFNNKTVTINPLSNLNPNTTYSVQMVSGVIISTKGGSYAGISDASTLNFTTFDTIAPSLISSSPADDASAVALGSNVLLTFSEKVKAGVGNIVLSDGVDVRTIAVGDTTQVSFSGNTVTINPALDLKPDSNYSVQLASGVIKDLAGNAYAGISDATSLNFATPDTIAPGLISSSPTDDASEVAPDSNILLTFSEKVKAGAGNIVLSDGVDVRTIAVSDTTQVSFGGNTVTINPALNLHHGSNYSVQLANGVIKDLTGNAYAGISDATTLNFFSADTNNLSQLVSFTATDATYHVGDTVVIKVNFNKVITVTTNGGTPTLNLSNGSSASYVSGSGSASLVFNYVVAKGNSDSADLDVGAILLNGGLLQDSAGHNADISLNGLSLAAVANVIIDGNHPILMNSSPSDNATAVAQDSNVVLTFNENVKAGMGNIVISDGVDVRTIPVGDTTQVSFTGNTVSINPVLDLKPDASYFVRLASGVIIDMAGNSYAGINNPPDFNFFTQSGTEIDLSAVQKNDNTGGFVINGISASDNSGASVSDAGDVNGDGLADLIVGAWGDSPHGSLSGASYVVFGKSDGTAVDLSAVANGIGGFVINGVNLYDRSGSSVSSAGDFNGDGLDDLIVGAPSDDPHGGESGASFVVFGKSDGAAVELAMIERSGIGGFVIHGVSAGDQSGKSVSGAGDVNGDGFADLIIGAPGDDPHGSSSGASFVVFGGHISSATVGSAGNDTLTGNNTANQLVAGGGDDLLIGNGGADVLRGGTGNDMLAVSDLNFASLDGGSGSDTLRFDAPLALDLRLLANNRLSSIEVIDLSQDGGNSTISFNITDILHLNEAGALVIHGNAGDVVNLDNYSKGQAGKWADAGNGVYQFTAVNGGISVVGTVAIDPDVSVSIII